MKFEPLSPLTGEDSEWFEASDGVYQNIRCSHVFKQNDRFDGKPYDINGIVFTEHYYDEDGIERTSSFTSNDSIVLIEFPYTPTTEYVDVGFRDLRLKLSENKMIEYTVRVYDDRTEWYLNGNLHRMDGPAIKWADGSTEWYLNGNLHRMDGPAIEYANGTKEWYLNGVNFTEEYVQELRRLKL